MALAPCGPQQPAIPVGFGRRPERPLFPAPRAARVPRADGADHGRHDISVAVVGAGPVGLLTALALARRGYRKVRVLDRLPQPPGPEEEVWGDPDRSYNLGLGGRGQRALLRFGAMEVVERFSRTVVGRKDWSSEGEPKITMNNRRFMTKVIARDRLSSCLYQELREKYPDVEVQFSTECTAVDFHHDTAKLQLQRCGPPLATEGLAQEESCDVTTESVKEMEADLVLGCDGIRSAVRQALRTAGADVEQQRFADRRPIVYRVLAIPTGKDDSTELNYSVRKDNVIVEALPNVEGNLLGVVLFRPTDERIEGLKSGAEAKKISELGPPKRVGTGTCSSKAMGASESVPVPTLFGGPSPVKLAATVLFHMPSAAKMRGAEPFDAFHTSIVLGEVEYAFSGQGIRATRPLVSHAMLNRNTEVRLIGHTNFSASQMLSFLNQFFQPGTYDLICKNCNSFSDCALYLLLGQRLEAKYSRMEKTGKAGQKRIGLMSALRLIGMNYKANPASQNFQVDEVLAKMDIYMRGHGVRGHPKLEDMDQYASTPRVCCC